MQTCTYIFHISFNGQYRYLKHSINGVTIFNKMVHLVILPLSCLPQLKSVFCLHNFMEVQYQTVEVLLRLLKHMLVQ